MAKFNEYGAAGALSGSEPVLVYQNNAVRQATAQEIANLAAGTAGGITDAPSDSNVYGRMNAGWDALGTAATLPVDTDATFITNSDSRIPSQKAIKTYVDGKVTGLSWKTAVRAATTTAGTLASSFANGSVIDGVTLATNDRILIKDQSSGTENGIYVVAASGAPTRSTDADSGSELVGASVYVSEGTVNTKTQWTCNTIAPILVDTTALVWAQLSSGGIADAASDSLYYARRNAVWSALGSASLLASDTDGTLAANSDTRAATQKAVRTYVAANAGGISDAPSDSQLYARKNATWSVVPAGGGATSIFDTLTAATAAHISPGTAWVLTQGYSAPGDGGDARYIPASAGAALGKFQSADGAWWKIDVSRGVRLEQFGGKADAKIDGRSEAALGSPGTATDNYAALVSILALAVPGETYTGAWTVAPKIYCGDGNYWFSQLPEIHCQLHVKGTAVGQSQSFLGGTCWLFPRSPGGLIFQSNGSSGRYSTYSNPAVGASDYGSSKGSLVEGVNFVGIGTQIDYTAHGVQMRDSVTLRDCGFINIAGDSIHAVGNAGPTSPEFGDVNAIEITNCANWNCLGFGLKIGGADSNSNNQIKFDSHKSGKSAICNESYFANGFDCGDLTAYGNNGVWYNGHNWQTVDINGRGGLTTPGTNNDIWRAVGDAAAAGARFTLWTSDTSSSTSSLTISPTVSLSLTVGAGKSWAAGQFIIISHDANNSMTGHIISYNSGTGALVCSIHSVRGSGTYATWTVAPSWDVTCAIFDNGSSGENMGTGSVYTAQYIELSETFCHIPSPSLFLGGTITTTTDSAGLLPAGFQRGSVRSPVGVGGSMALPSAASAEYPNVGGPVSAVGPTPSENASAFVDIGTYDTVKNAWVLRQFTSSRVAQSAKWSEYFNNYGDLILEYGNGGFKRVNWMTTIASGYGAVSPNAPLGRYTIVENMFCLPGYGLGGMDYGTNHVLVRLGNAAPTTGQAGLGERVVNDFSIDGTVAEWINTTKGANTSTAWGATTTYNLGDAVTNDSGKHYVCIQPAAWAQNTAYTTGNLVSGVNATMYVCTTSGTSSTTGTGPYSWGTGITDGTAVWSSFTNRTSAGSGGPTGTGTSIVDNHALWSYAPPFNYVGNYLNARNSPTIGIGYITGAGGAATQTSSRTSTVTLNTLSGAITLVSAAGTASWQTFTLVSSSVTHKDVPLVVQKFGTDKYLIHVTRVDDGGFDITFATTGGTTTEQPVFAFAVIKGADS